MRPHRVALLLILLTQPAWAQAPREARDAIRSCLCAEQSMAELDVEVHQRGAILAARRSELAVLDAASRAAAGDDQARLQSERRQTAKIIAGVLAPLYDDSRVRYAAARDDFSRNCARRKYDPALVARLRQELICVGVSAGPLAPSAAPGASARRRARPEFSRPPSWAPLW